MAIMGDHPLMVNFMTEVIFKNSKGEWPRTEIIDQDSRFGGFCIGHFQKDGVKGGTGSIIKLLYGHSNSFALVLTSGHIFLKDFQYLKEMTTFKIGREKFLAISVKNDLNWDLFFKDSISGVNLSVPDDWTVCTISKIPSRNYIQKYIELGIYDVFSALPPDIDIEVHGFPLTPTSNMLSYIAPESLVKDLRDVKETVWNGSGLICSKGKILAENETMAISCASANGMSGSPVIIITPSGPQIIAILFGGPATKIHYYCALILHYKEQASTLTEKLLKHIRKYHVEQIFLAQLLENFSKLTDLEFQLFWDMLSIIYSTAIMLEKDRIMWKYNNAISIKSIWNELAALVNKY